MTAQLSFTVVGIPGAQGSKRHLGHGVLVESSKKVTPWRADVKAAAMSAITQNDWQILHGPVRLTVVFYFCRPKSHFGTGRNAATLKPSAPAVPHNRASGDNDKLQRSTLDALTEAGAFADDSQVSDVTAIKRYCAGTMRPGALIAISALSEDIAVEDIELDKELTR